MEKIICDKCGKIIQETTPYRPSVVVAGSMYEDERSGKVVVATSCSIYKEEYDFCAACRSKFKEVLNKFLEKEKREKIIEEIK